MTVKDPNHPTDSSQEYEKELLKPHAYDGIREYDNQLPRWWLGTFFLTVIFAILYWVYFYITGSGLNQKAEYELANKISVEQAVKVNAKEVPVTAQAIQSLVSDPAVLLQAKTVFATNCAACHGEDGGGVIGPNLTDNAWIHGGRPEDVYRTIEIGVSAKGMPAWHGVLSSSQIRGLVAYVVSLQGSSPVNKKAPEGIEVQ